MNGFLNVVMFLVVPGWSGEADLDKTGTSQSVSEAALTQLRKNLADSRVACDDTPNANISALRRCERSNMRTRVVN
jgi:hypothetical protein